MELGRYAGIDLAEIGLNNAAAPVNRRILQHGNGFDFFHHLQEIIDMFGRQFKISQVDPDNHVSPALELSQGLNDIIYYYIFLIFGDYLDHFFGDQQHQVDNLGLGLGNDLAPFLYGRGYDPLQVVNQTLHFGPAFLKSFFLSVLEPPVKSFLINSFHFLLDFILELLSLPVRFLQNSPGLIPGFLPDLLGLVVFAFDLIEGDSFRFLLYFFGLLLSALDHPGLFFFPASLELLSLAS